MSDKAKVPEGYMENGLGHLVPVANVPALDVLRDETVRELVGRAEETGRAVAEFRALAAARVAGFCEMSSEAYGVAICGEKGNVTLTSFDGSMRVTRARADEISFTEEVRVTRELCFRCIEKWSAGANANLATLVRKSFETDKDGHLSASKILSLRSYEITGDADWDAAMAALDGAIQVIGSRQYVRFYRRGPDGKYAQVGVDCGKGGA